MATTKKVTEIIKSTSGKFIDAKTSGYQNASKRFEKLVDKGLTTKRGNRLISADKAHISKWSFNKA